MVQKSYGKMRGARKKLMNPAKPTITQMLAKFEIGDKVHVVLNASGRFQHPRFFGKTGTVLAKTGRHYIVEIKDGNLAKKLILTPEHLKKGNA
jgi:large subunit ribosomal protein L21e